MDVRVSLESALGDSLTIDRELGGGGMSRVFVAIDRALGREVVVKVLSLDLESVGARDRFAREIRTAAALQSPHIVPLFTAGTTADGSPWYTMPFVRGESLRAHMERGLMSADRALGYLRDVALALEHAHKNGVVHRDIKPENVLVSGPTAMVVDFGIAKALRAAQASGPSSEATPEQTAMLTRTGMAIGTPAYMAPEQATGEADVDARADLYSWGVMAYELLAGRHPFAHATSAPKLLAAHLTEAPIPLADVVGTAVPRSVTELVMRCLAKEAADRPSGAEELITSLARTGERAATAMAHPRAAGKVRRAPLIAGTVLLAMVAGATALWTATRGGVTSESGTAAPAGRDRSEQAMVAVMPFVHQGPEEQRVFTDGLTDQVTAKLSALKGLGVIARSSVETAKAGGATPVELGRQLGVSWLVDGVVRWARLRDGTWSAQVVPTLIDARDGTAVWSGDGITITPDDPFTAQAQVAVRVAQQLRGALAPADRARLEHVLTDQPEAFAAYQRGISVRDAQPYAKGSVRAAQLALAEFQQAVSLDSAFADAWAQIIVQRLRLVGMQGGALSAIEALQQDMAAASRLAPNHPSIILAGAAARFYVFGKQEGVARDVFRAAGMLPGEAGFISISGRLLSDLAEYDSAAAYARRAVRLAPNEPYTLLWAAEAALLARRYDEARAWLNTVLARDSTNAEVWGVLAHSYHAQGDTAGMRRIVDAAARVFPSLPLSVVEEMSVLGGDRAREVLRYPAPSIRGLSTLDSVGSYYSRKADAAEWLGDSALARVYWDSTRAIVSRATPRSAGTLLWSARADAGLGRTAAARQALAASGITIDELQTRPPQDQRVFDYLIIETLAMLGDADETVRWMERSLAERVGFFDAHGFLGLYAVRRIANTPAVAAFSRRHTR